MATEVLTELELFHDFIGKHLQTGGRSLSLEESVNAFRAYQRGLERFKQDLEGALAESARGESEPLDVEDIIVRGRQRAGEKGITD